MPPPPATAVPTPPPPGYATSPSLPPPPGTYPPYGAAPLSANPFASQLGAPAGPRLDPGVAQRLSALESNLGALSMGSGAIAEGVMEAVTGGLFIGLGAWARNTGSVQTGNYFYVYGGMSVGRALIDFTLKPNPQRYAVAYTNMPMATTEDAMARLRYGEDSLRMLAYRYRTARLLDGGLQIAAGAISIPILVGPEGFAHADAFTYIIAITGGITIITGLVAMLTPTSAERRWKSYQRLVARLNARNAPPPSRPPYSLERSYEVGAFALPGGFGASYRLRF